jgi:histidine ammonia-lyase
MLLIDGKSLSLADLERVADGDSDVRLSDSSRACMQKSRQIVEDMIQAGKTIYGVNTGFGKLSDVRIPAGELQKLQKNLIMSHACGVGPELSSREVRAMLLLKANGLASGFSGCRPIVADYLLEMLRHDMLPIVPEKGSVGASGDLAPLAHLCLPMLGLGDVHYRGRRIPAGAALIEAGLPAIELQAKEGISLINGTQFMTAVAALAFIEAERIAAYADITGAMSAEALFCTDVAFDARIQEARGHDGQKRSAAVLRQMMTGSEIRESHRDCARVQDAYSIRCMPQVHGAVRDHLHHLRQIITTELNACTDNPLVFAGDNEILSGGNFHGHPIATAADLISLLATQLANISERRIAFMMDPGLSELPPFLVKSSGINSGFMLAHVAAASLVSENKVLSHPASVDSIPTSANKEDYVSMGAAAAVKARHAVHNAATVLGIELLCAAQSLDLRSPLKPGPGAAKALACVREQIPILDEDRVLAGHVEAAKSMLRGGDLLIKLGDIIDPLLP